MFTPLDRRDFLRTAPLAAVALGGPAAAQPAGGGGFRAGAATSNITPALGGLIVGGFRPFPAEHVHDELHARCLVLDNGQTRLALVVLDLLGAAQAVFDEARRLVAAETGLPGGHLFVSCTHTHSAVGALGENRYDPKAPLDDYQKFVARRVADGVRRAIRNLAPAEIGWAVGSEPREVFNRRWFMKPGTVPANPFGETTDRVKMNPPRGSPDLEKPAGPTDPEVSVIAVRAPGGGRPIAVYASYSLHYVGGVRGADVSADYFALFCDRLRQLLGADRLDPPFVAMLANGTSGNINNIDFTKKAERREPYEKMREVADRVAEAAHKAYQTIRWQPAVPLAGKLETLEIALRHPTPDQLARAKVTLAQPEKPGAPVSLERVYAGRTVKLADSPDTIPLPLQALRVGDVAIGGIPCEVFVETGLAFKAKCPFKPAFVVSLNNGYYGYLPTPEHHDLGGYETWLGTNQLEKHASTKILDRLLAMAAGLK